MNQRSQKNKKKKTYIPGPGEYNLQNSDYKTIGFAQSLRKYEFLDTGTENNPGPNYFEEKSSKQIKGGKIPQAKKPEVFKIIEGPDPAQYNNTQSSFINKFQRKGKKQSKRISIDVEELAKILLNNN